MDGIREIIVLGLLEVFEGFLAVLFGPVSFADVGFGCHGSTGRAEFCIIAKIIVETVDGRIVLFLIEIDTSRLELEHRHFVFVFREHFGKKVKVFNGLFIFAETRTENGGILKGVFGAGIFFGFCTNGDACRVVVRILLDEKFVEACSF